MIGMFNSYLPIYLYVVGIAMMIGFGIPLLIVPMQWARLFRWEIPQPQELTVFLGRSVGVFISVLAVFAFRVANNPAAQPFFFDLLLWIIAGSLLIHVYGALRKAQPITETVEILVWILLFITTLTFYPT
jgi:hypothetical protein